jgi:hypothetical protein
MWQQLLVLAMVATSAAYAAWSLLPPVTRWRWRSRLATTLARMPAPVAALGRRLLQPSVAPDGTGCAACPASAAHKAPHSRR